MQSSKDQPLPAHVVVVHTDALEPVVGDVLVAHVAVAGHVEPVAVDIVGHDAAGTAAPVARAAVDLLGQKMCCRPPP